MPENRRVERLRDLVFKNVDEHAGWRLFVNSQDAGLNQDEAVALIATGVLNQCLYALPELHESDSQAFERLITGIENLIMQRPVYRKLDLLHNERPNEK